MTTDEKKGMVVTIHWVWNGQQNTWGAYREGYQIGFVVAHYQRGVERYRYNAFSLTKKIATFWSLDAAKRAVEEEGR